MVLLSFHRAVRSLWALNLRMERHAHSISWSLMGLAYEHFNSRFRANNCKSSNKSVSWCGQKVSPLLRTCFCVSVKSCEERFITFKSRVILVIVWLQWIFNCDSDRVLGPCSLGLLGPGGSCLEEGLANCCLFVLLFLLLEVLSDLKGVMCNCCCLMYQIVMILGHL